jgi:hypothetical protein
MAPSAGATMTPAPAGAGIVDEDAAGPRGEITNLQMT